MVRVSILGVTEGKGEIIELELEGKDGEGRLYLDANICLNPPAHGAMRTAFCLLQPKRDVLVRYGGRECRGLCGASLGLPLYLGMYALLNGLEVNPAFFATGGLSKDGKVTPAGALAEKIKAILGRAQRLLVPSGQGLPIEGLEMVEASDIKEAARLFFNENRTTD